MTDKEYYDSLKDNWDVKPFLISLNDPLQAPGTGAQFGIDTEKFIRGKADSETTTSEVV